MNILKRTMILAGCVAALGLGSTAAMAQGGGGGGGGGRGAQFQQQRMDQIRGEMDIKDDAAWGAISAKITAVTDAQRAMMAGRGGRGRGGRGGGGAGGGGGGGGGGAGGGGPQVSDSVAALQKAVDDKAPAAEIKDKLAKVRDEAKSKQAAFAAAQEDLRSIVNSRQEAILVLNGILN